MCSTDDGRLAFGTRFFKQSYGSLNLVNHGSCAAARIASGSGRHVRRHEENAACESGPGKYGILHFT